MKIKLELTYAELISLFHLANNTYLEKEEFFSFEKRQINAADRAINKIIEALRIHQKKLKERLKNV